MIRSCVTVTATLKYGSYDPNAGSPRTSDPVEDDGIESTSASLACCDIYD